VLWSSRAWWRIAAIRTLWVLLAGACLMLVRGDDSFTGIHPALPASAPPLAAHQWYNRFRFSSREAYSLLTDTYYVYRTHGHLRIPHGSARMASGPHWANATDGLHFSPNSSRSIIRCLDFISGDQHAPTSTIPTDTPYTHPDDLHALMTHLGIEHAYIVGLSLGGAVAVDFAVTYPHATAALIPVDAALLGGYEWLEGRPSSAVIAQAQQAGLQAAKTFWLQHPLFAPAHEQPAVAARLAVMVEDYSGWHLVNDDPGRVLEPPAIQRLATINAPTLIIIGERDVVDFHRIADILQERIPGAKKVVMLGVGHMANMEDPERFNEIVLGFLAKI
jgi:3-oxoadipate enol-lactonase